MKLKIAAPKEYIKKIEGGKLSLEYLEKDGKRKYLVALKNYGKTFYVGELIPGKSKMRRVPEKAQKHQLKTAQCMSGPKGEKIFTFVVVNFARFEDMEEFEKAYQAALDFKPE